MGFMPEPPILCLLLILGTVASTCCSAGLQHKGSGMSQAINADIAKGWTVCSSANSSICDIPASVPGQVQLDLLHAGKIGAPYYRFNDVAVQWIGSVNWTYTTLVDSSVNVSSLLAKQRVDLVIEGVDTIGSVFLNGHALGSTNNQFRRYVFSIKPFLSQPGKNNLTIVLTGPVPYANRQASAYPYAVPHATFPTGLPNMNFIRKRPSDFGWDWGPALAPVGLWRPVTVIAYDQAVVEDFWVEVTLNDGGLVPSTTIDSWPKAYSIADDAYFIVNASISVRCSGSGIHGATDDILIQVEIQGLNSSVHGHIACRQQDDKGDEATVASLSLHVPASSVSLWFPRGYGDQALYSIHTTLSSSGTVIHTAARRIGFRLAEVVTEPLPSGEEGLSMYFRINGMPVYAKGASLVPLDAFDGRLSELKMNQTLQAAVAANYNMIRIWGGGDYGRADLWMAADELGILIWLDLQFASSLYPRDNAFVQNVAKEVRHQARRLTGHAALVVWCGNNEGVIDTYRSTTSDTEQLFTADYTVLFDQTVRSELWRNSPAANFYASSPSNGAVVDDPENGMYIHRFLTDAFDPRYGDVRHYDYNDDCTDVTTYPRGRFVSEYGWQSYPSLHSLQNISLPSDWDNNSTLMNHRQHHPDGNAQMASQISRFFHLPGDSNTTSRFHHFIYLSQVVQSLCIGTQSRLYRTLKQQPGAYTMGNLYWQLNDVWQAQSWASLEYDVAPRWKLLHNDAREAYAPLMIAGFVSNASAQANLTVVLVSDLPSMLNVVVDIESWKWDGDRLKNISFQVDIAALGTKVVFNDSISQVLGSDPLIGPIRLTATSSSQPNLTSSSVVYPKSFVNLSLPDPQIIISSSAPCSPTAHDVGGRVDVCLVLKSTACAAWVMLETAHAGYWSDNGFLLIPEEPKSVAFVSYEDESPSPEELAHSTQITTVYDTQ